jgi:hypothetical protein
MRAETRSRHFALLTHRCRLLFFDRKPFLISFIRTFFVVWKISTDTAKRVESLSLADLNSRGLTESENGQQE